MAYREQRFCGEDGCSNSHFARGQCKSHYGHAYRRIYKQRTLSKCLRENCNKPVKAQGVCTAHYKSGRKSGELQRIVFQKPCSVNGCSKQAVSKKKCPRHYYAERRALGHRPKYDISKEHASWSGMISRCCNPNHPSYPNYGGRGISVCERWRLYKNFLADMGRKPSPELTLERIDNNGHYESGNCRWATRLTQANNKRNNRVLEYNGERKTLSQWARIRNMKRLTLLARLDNGWTTVDALTQPVQVSKKENHNEAKKIITGARMPLTFFHNRSSQTANKG